MLSSLLFCLFIYSLAHIPITNLYIGLYIHACILYNMYYTYLFTNQYIEPYTNGTHLSSHMDLSSSASLGRPLKASINGQTRYLLTQTHYSHYRISQAAVPFRSVL